VAPDAQGARQHIILAVGNDGQFAKFCAVAGHPEWATDPRFATNKARVLHRHTLVPLLETALRTRIKADWLATLEQAKVPCGPINSLADVFADTHVLSRDMVQTWDHPLNPALQLVASPLKLSATPVVAQHPPPLLGQHTRQVLAEVLALSPTRIDALVQSGVV
jgi:crotonobetainyl-CoA:carnitine CoA-transferase CaiB-like acyl-CoA transferase